MSTLSENLKELRKLTGLTQAEFCKVLDLKQKTYQTYEVARSEPNIETLNKLASHYGVSLDVLIRFNINIKISKSV